MNLAAGYATHSITVVGGSGNASNFLEYTGRHDPRAIWLDNVGIADANAPEPLSVMLMAAGLVACGLGRRWRLLLPSV